MHKDRGRVRKISDFIVGEKCGLPAFHCTWISNSPVRWQGGTVSAHLCPTYIYSHSLESVCDVAGGFGCRWLHKGNSPECVLRT